MPTTLSYHRERGKGIPTTSIILNVAEESPLCIEFGHASCLNDASQTL